MSPKPQWLERTQRAEDRLDQLQIWLAMAALAVISLIMVFDVWIPIPRGPGPSVPAPTSHEAAIAESLRDHPVYVDAQLRDQVTSDLLTPPVMKEIEGGDSPVFVVVSPALVPASARGRSTLATQSAQRIAEATDRDGVYLMVDGSGDRLVSVTRDSGSDEAQVTSVSGVLEPADLQRAIQEARRSPAISFRSSDWLLEGVGEGVGLSVVVWFLWHCLRWLRQRTWHSSRWEGFE